jgi:type II secretory ATPase GspE/PulE/Tfp pilus assembly ATPase PilB-like protein
VTTYVAIGCDECDHTGYRGRIALHEVLANSDDLRRLIREGASVSELQHTCINTGMKTLKQDGITKFLKGDTDMLQVRKVCIT